MIRYLSEFGILVGPTLEIESAAASEARTIPLVWFARVSSDSLKLRLHTIM